jgi:hypothetical protein
MKTKKLYNKKNKTNKNKNIFLNKIKKNTKKRQRKIYKGGFSKYLSKYLSIYPFKNKSEKQNSEISENNVYLRGDYDHEENEPYLKEKKPEIIYEENPLHDVVLKKNSTVKDYETIYETGKNPFYNYNTDIEKQKKDFNNVFNDNGIYFDIIKKEYNYETSKIDGIDSNFKPKYYNNDDFLIFKNILLKIFKRNFNRILELFNIELYYFLYFTLLDIQMDIKNDTKNNVLDLFKKFYQSILFIEDCCLNRKNNDFSEISYFFNNSKTFIISLRNLFDKDELKNIIDTFSYSILCIKINSYIYNSKSFNIGQKTAGGGKSILNNPFFKYFYKEEKDDSNESNTIYNFFETPEKKNKLKEYFSDNKKIIIEKIKKIINNNYLLKVIVFFCIKNKKEIINENKKEIINETKNSEVPRVTFESEIQTFETNIKKEYGNFLNDFYENIFSNNEPGNTEIENFLLEIEKEQNKINKDIMNENFKKELDKIKDFYNK